ncbi:MAG: DHH family phosphoesterase [Bermanella sp.]
MADYDLFNGDADGICALIQLRLAEPKDSILVTGIKRDNELLKKIDVKAGDQVTVLDVSMKKNTAALQVALDRGASVFYCDHHQAGVIAQHENLQAHIYTESTTCTSLIVNKLLNGRFQEWAIVAAFGDNITTVARELCEKQNYSADQVEQIRTLGICFNYNGYGSSLSDLFYHPSDLYKVAVQYESPFDFIKKEPNVFAALKKGYTQDMEKALSVKAAHENETAAMFILPNEKWARRVSGVLGNELANRFPDRAHAILTENKELTEREEKNDSPVGDKEKTYKVSIRASKSNPLGADDIAMKFGGGGRKGAAGIDVLLESDISHFYSCIELQYT